MSKLSAYELLTNIHTKVAKIETKMENTVTKEEFAIFKTRVYTIGGCVSTAAGVLGWFLK